MGRRTSRRLTISRALSTAIAGQTVHVRCLQTGRLYEPKGSLDRALKFAPGLTGREAGPAMKVSNPGMANVTVQGPRNSIPRLAADSAGRVYLTFRSGAGLKSQIGSIYHQFMTLYNGSDWTPAVEIPFTFGPVDLRPSIVALAPGEILAAAITDHRRSVSGPVGEETTGSGSENLDRELLAVTSVGIATPASPPQLTAIAALAIPKPAPETVAERASIATLRAYRVDLPAGKFQVMRGEFHRHTEFSADGGADGPLIDAYRYLIDSGGMDWGGCCDHDNGGGREYSWWLEQKLTDAYHLGGNFVPMFSYERSVVYPEGHRNAIFVQRGVRPLPRLPVTKPNSPSDHAPDTQMLYNYLRQYDGIVASHTSGTSMGTDWRDNDPILEPVVEIYQGERQNYEMEGAPRAMAEGKTIAGYHPLGFVSNALKKGYRLGFESSERPHFDAHFLLQPVGDHPHPRRCDGGLPQAQNLRLDRQHPGRRALRRPLHGRGIYPDLAAGNPACVDLIGRWRTDPSPRSTSSATESRSIRRRRNRRKSTSNGATPRRRPREPPATTTSAENRPMGN